MGVFYPLDVLFAICHSSRQKQRTMEDFKREGILPRNETLRYPRHRNILSQDQPIYCVKNIYRTMHVLN